MNARDEVESFTRDLLAQRVARLTPKQAEFLNHVYQGRVPAEKLLDAIALCDRTISKNEKAAVIP